MWAVRVRQRSPLTDPPAIGTPLDTVTQTPVTDLTPLKNLKLTEIRLDPKNIKAGLDVIRNMKTLSVINQMDAKEFWRTFGAR